MPEGEQPTGQTPAPSFSDNLAKLFKDVEKQMGDEAAKRAKEVVDKAITDAQEDAVKKVRAMMGLDTDRAVMLSELPDLLRKAQLETGGPAKRTAEEQKGGPGDDPKALSVAKIEQRFAQLQKGAS